MFWILFFESSKRTHKTHRAAEFSTQTDIACLKRILLSQYTKQHNIQMKKVAKKNGNLAFYDFCTSIGMQHMLRWLYVFHKGNNVKQKGATLNKGTHQTGEISSTWIAFFIVIHSSSRALCVLLKNYFLTPPNLIIIINMSEYGNSECTYASLKTDWKKAQCTNSYCTIFEYVREYPKLLVKALCGVQKRRKNILQTCRVQLGIIFSDTKRTIFWDTHQNILNQSYNFWHAV